jgi:hypothetical protein
MMNTSGTAGIDPSVMYKSVRDEILEQKKCQFNLFAASVTVNAAVLAYSAASKVGPLVYLAPIVLNILAVTIILDKAGSIQRMVGYLQLMENPSNKFLWMWEFHLRRYRAAPGRSEGFEGFRRHSYVVTVASMLLVLNLLCAALYFRGPIRCQANVEEESVVLACSRARTALKCFPGASSEPCELCDRAESARKRTLVSLSGTALGLRGAPLPSWRESSSREVLDD